MNRFSNLFCKSIRTIKAPPHKIINECFSTLSLFATKTFCKKCGFNGNANALIMKPIIETVVWS